MRAFSILALLFGLLLGSTGCTIIVEPEPPNLGFEHFRQDWGWGPCPPGEDCNGSVALWNDGSLRLDLPCFGNMDCTRIPAGTHLTVISSADLEAAIAVLTDPALVGLLDRDQPVCQAPPDIGESMTLDADGVTYANGTTMCDQAPLQAARDVLADLVARYFDAEPEPDPEPEPALELVEAGWHFGMCSEACRNVLTMDADQVRYVIGSFRSESQIYLDNVGTLTQEGREAWERILAELEEVMLQKIYGCPDCADGGTAYVALARGSEVTTHTYEFFRPPPELSALDAWRTALMDALETCTSTALVTVSADCVPRLE